ncbi:MAG: metallophosphoesterase family protein [Acidimicrobiales bacterium]|nr:metallophosphoesterase family protein [Acidimicrobiales bacterium]
MIPRSPRIEVFATEDRSAQILWRDLRCGELVLTPSHGPPLSMAIDPHLTTGGATLDGLPPGRSIDIVASGPAVPTPIVTRTRTMPPLPGEELARIGTISDLHLGAVNFGHRGTLREHPTPDTAHPRRCTDAALRATTRWGAEVVVAKGDLTNRGQIHEWREYADLVHAASVPIIGVPGNHDRAFRNGLAPEDAARAFGLTLASPLHVVDGAGYRLVLVDSTTGGHNHGRLDAVADDAVTAVAETEPGSVALVFLHHQLHRWPVREVWPVGVGRLESRRFMEAVARTGTRCMVSSGHTHRHRRWEHREVTATQVGSTKDYPGVWAGYVITDRAVRQVVHRVTEPDCLRWTEFTRRAAGGTWRWVAPGLLPSRCFDQIW